MPSNLLLLMAQSLAADLEAPRVYLLTAGNVFLLFFFIMLGPVKAIGPFFTSTRDVDATELRSIAWKVFALAVLTVILAGLVGSALLVKWHISTPVMELAGGLVFLLVALQLVLAQYKAPDPQARVQTAPQVMYLLFPVTITPYGIAALIVLIALSGDLSRTLTVLGFAVAVMVLNLLAMLFVRPIMRWIGPVPLQILGAVLGILQVALALQFMVGALKGFGILAMSP